MRFSLNSKNRGCLPEISGPLHLMDQFGRLYDDKVHLRNILVTLDKDSQVVSSPSIGQSYSLCTSSSCLLKVSAASLSFAETNSTWCIAPGYATVGQPYSTWCIAPGYAPRATLLNLVHRTWVRYLGQPYSIAWGTQPGATHQGVRNLGQPTQPGWVLNLKPYSTWWGYTTSGFLLNLVQRTRGVRTLLNLVQHTGGCNTPGSTQPRATLLNLVQHTGGYTPRASYSTWCNAPGYATSGTLLNLVQHTGVHYLSHQLPS